jgi:hypothetical protein
MVWNKRRVLVLSLLNVASMLLFSIVYLSTISLIDVPTAPASRHFTFLSFAPLVEQGEDVGGLAVCDEWTTGQSRKYSQRRDEAGELLGLVLHDRGGHTGPWY